MCCKTREHAEHARDPIKEVWVNFHYAHAENHLSLPGSATQVMLSMPFRDTVDQHPIDITEVNSTHGQPRVLSSVRLNPIHEKWPYSPWHTEPCM
jgi:hypothetical protein